MKLPKDNILERLHDIAAEIVAGTRKAVLETGAAKPGTTPEIRIPIIMHGTDIRVVIEAGPSVARRNVIEQAQLKAGGKMAPRDEVIGLAMSLLSNYATEVKADNGKEAYFSQVVGCVRALEALRME